MTGFPSINSYEQARAHFDSVEPWSSKYNEYGDERPIGVREVKLDHSGRRFNKAMRKRDEDIIFRLYAQDCVIWHANGELTVHGYGSMSTTAFISSLVPWGIDHLQGRKDEDEPVLHLRADRPNTDGLEWGESRPIWQAYWRSGCIIRGDYPIRFRQEDESWVPVDGWDSLHAFSVPRVDTRAARAVSKQYNLPTLQQIVRAIMALNAPPPPPSNTWAPGSVRYGEIMDALERADYMAAIGLMPRGTKKGFGRKVYGTDDGIQPGFLTQLRNHIYDHEGVVDRVERRTLSVSGYRKMIADLNRFY